MGTLQQRMNEYLRARGVNPKYAQEAGLFSASGAKARELGSPFAQDAIVIPYYDPFSLEQHQTLVRFRYLSTSLPADKNGKEAKFAQPKGSGVEAYFDKHVDWKKVAKNNRIPIFFVEGEIKALAMNQNGFVTIGLGGVDSFGGASLTPYLREVLA